MKKSIALLGVVLSLACSEKQFPQFSLQNAYPNLTFTSPVDLQNAGDGTDRIFVVEQAGIIYVIENNPSAAVKKVFLNMVDSVSSGSEMGLLGLAFHPNYESNGYFYVNYTKSSPYRRTLISRFRVSSSNPDSADRSSATILMEISQPYSNHNGGQLAFGPDGFLYIALGDGGSGGDPDNNGQNRSSLLGKLLRIDVDQSQGSINYAIPPDNPFKNNTQGFKEEIYAYGLRNPWRFSFDFPTGRLWCGDVGQSAREEIDIIVNGGNYGWRCYEGSLPYNLSGCSDTNYIPPIWDYPRSEGYSVTGGYVYRGPNLPELFGKYIYGDYGTRRIWALTYDGINPPTNQLLLTANSSISSFGVDLNNELYVVGYNGIIYRFTPTAQIVAPSNLRIIGNIPGSITLAWNDNSNNEIGFKIERKSGSGNFILIDSVGANVTTFIDTSSNLNELFSYRVFAYNSTAASGYSNTVSLNTYIPVEIPELTATVNYNSVLINWVTITETNNKGFEVERSWLKLGSNSTTRNYEKIGFVSGNGTTASIHSYSFSDKVFVNGIYTYRLKQIDFDGNFTYLPELEIIVYMVPEKFILHQNYPNPFNPSTKIKYNVPNVGTQRAVSVQLKVYDVLGNEVATLVDEYREAGSYEVEFNTVETYHGMSLLSGVSTKGGYTSGVYFYQLKAGNFIETKKMILLR